MLMFAAVVAASLAASLSAYFGLKGKVSDKHRGLIAGLSIYLPVGLYSLYVIFL